MRTSDFDYPLPQELIAQTPMEPRDQSRLLVLDMAAGAMQHHRFRDIVELLHPGDLLVFNDSRVIPARLRGRKAGSGGQVELLLLHPMEPRLWQALARPGKRLAAGAVLRFQGQGKEYSAEIESKSEGGVVTVRLEDEAMIEACGETPLPPYIHERLADPERYQTVYARVRGSAAAPTAGLHFTPELLQRLQSQGVAMAFVTLHVGLDTFRPVDEDDPREHSIHTEYAVLPPETAAAVNATRARGGRIVAVGTTSVRVLETAARGALDLRLSKGEGATAVAPYSGWTDVFILPGHRFRAVDAMITNFHLPRSTLLMLVSAFAGRERVLAAYVKAVRERYRFYSFGDAMWVG
ncbi:MAG: tRNA preQ1(34) S-adenosylmethionine ribosyltransferase-isomerase QueA [Dehalococcoidia bacterium]|nr:tRNA preQ1(34) S-adenosylmethionine ribosyltransferase-isomerase QueA [Dehalococcoidia bacterium]